MYLYIYPAGPALLECTRRTHLLFPSVRAYPQGGWVHLRDEQKGKKKITLLGGMFLLGPVSESFPLPSPPPPPFPRFPSPGERREEKLNMGYNTVAYRSPGWTKYLLSIG